MDDNPHPGELLRLMIDLTGMNQKDFAAHAGVGQKDINNIVCGRRGYSAATAIKLARALGVRDRFFWDLHVDYKYAQALVEFTVEHRPKEEEPAPPE